MVLKGLDGSFVKIISFYLGFWPRREVHKDSDGKLRCSQISEGLKLLMFSQIADAFAFDDETVVRHKDSDFLRHASQKAWLFYALVQTWAILCESAAGTILNFESEDLCRSDALRGQQWKLAFDSVLTKQAEGATLRSDQNIFLNLVFLVFPR